MVSSICDECGYLVKSFLITISLSINFWLLASYTKFLALFKTFFISLCSFLKIAFVKSIICWTFTLSISLVCKHVYFDSGLTLLKILNYIWAVNIVWNFYKDCNRVAAVVPVSKLKCSVLKFIIENVYMSTIYKYFK